MSEEELLQDGQKVNASVKDLTGQVVTTAPVPVPPEMATKAKVSSHFLNAYFTTDDTIKNYEGQLELFDFNTTQDIAKTKANLSTIIARGYKQIDLTYPESRVMKGLFSLLEKQNASETRPFVVLKNISELYDEILEKKVTKRGKYKDFSGAEVNEAKDALDKLSKETQQIIFKGQDGKDKKGKPLYFFYMAEKPLISIEYLKRQIPQSEVDKMTETELKETGQIKITILPIFLKDYQKYFKLLPKDISREIREKCPDVKKVSEPLVNFIDLLHRQESQEVRRERTTLVKELRLDKEYRQKKGRTTGTLLKCYNIAKRTGYLADYQTDQKGKYGLVDIFYLNPDKFYHLRTRAEQRQAENKDAVKDDIKVIAYDKA